MSKLNIWFAAVIIVLAGFGLYFAGKLATKRNAITAQVVAEKKKRDDNADQISKLKITRQAELDELNRVMADWGGQWTAKGQVDQQLGNVLLGIGASQGLQKVPSRPDEVVHLFSIDANGDSRYLGEFKIGESGPQQALLTLNRKPRPGELETWPAQGDFRVRQRIPPGVRSTFHDLATNQAVADQIVINEKAKEQIQQNHIAASQKTLDRRMLELNGDPAAPPTADPEIVSGLVETLRAEEAQRNVVLKEVDALRRKLSDSYARLVRILAENSQAVDSLAAGTETAASPARPAN